MNIDLGRGTPLAFQRCRMTISQHPIAFESPEIRNGYLKLLYGLVAGWELNDPLPKKKLLAYLSYWGISVDHVIQPSSSEIRRLGRATNVKQFINFRRTNLKYLLLGDVLFLLHEHWADLRHRDYFQLFLRALRLRSKTVDEFFDFFHSLCTIDRLKATELLRKPKYRVLRFFLQTTIERSAYEYQKTKEVLIIATMSAGKSTLLNALIGKSLFPTRNEACTAKRINSYHNSLLDHFIAYSDGWQQELEPHVSPERLAHWNNSDECSLIHVEGRWSSLASDQKLVLIDTPGTNNSMDREHGKVTHFLLKHVAANLIVYVLDATKFGIDDDRALLQAVYKEFVKPPRRDILFLLNKVDQLDEDRDDDLHNLLQQAHVYLQEVGFHHPHIVPVSAYAALLFQTALYEGPMSRKETREFASLMDRFTQDERYDLRHFVGDEEIRQEEIMSPFSQEEVQIGNQTYQKAQIEQALQHTSIPYVGRLLSF